VLVDHRVEIGIVDDVVDVGVAVVVQQRVGIARKWRKSARLNADGVDHASLRATGGGLEHIDQWRTGMSVALADA
jgi:hypothetical protein